MCVCLRRYGVATAQTAHALWLFCQKRSRAAGRAVPISYRVGIAAAAQHEGRMNVLGPEGAQALQQAWCGAVRCGAVVVHACAKKRKCITTTKLKGNLYHLKQVCVNYYPPTHPTPTHPPHTHPHTHPVFSAKILHLLGVAMRNGLETHTSRGGGGEGGACLSSCLLVPGVSFAAVPATPHTIMTVAVYATGRV